jgi:transcription elongation factor Elf1
MKYKTEYLESGGTGCPFCRAQEISASSMHVDHGGVEQRIECEKCGEAWFDVYKLVDVEDVAS